MLNIGPVTANAAYSGTNNYRSEYRRSKVHENNLPTQGARFLVTFSLLRMHENPTGIIYYVQEIILFFSCENTAVNIQEMADRITELEVTHLSSHVSVRLAHSRPQSSCLLTATKTRTLGPRIVAATSWCKIGRIVT